MEPSPADIKQVIDVLSVLFNPAAICAVTAAASVACFNQKSKLEGYGLGAIALFTAGWQTTERAMPVIERAFT